MTLNHDVQIDNVWGDPANYDPAVDAPPYLEKKMLVKNASVAQMVRNASPAVVADVEGIVQGMVAPFGHAPRSDLAALLAFTRALAHVHQAHHWMTRGRDFYQDHLLFERIYNTAAGEIDPLAEKAVGTGSYLYVHPVLQLKNMGTALQCYYNGLPTDPNPMLYPLVSLKAELCYMLVLQCVYDCLERDGLLSMGIDNLLQGFADHHEESLYLLKQRQDQ